MSAKIRRYEARRKRRIERHRAKRRKVQQQLRNRRRRIDRRLDKTNGGGARPMFAVSHIHYEIAEKTRALSAGGLGSMHLLAGRLGLAEAIDRRVHVLKLHLPYHESDHVLNLPFGVDVMPNLHVRADELPETDWQPLERPPRYTVKTKPRRKPEKVKKKIVRQRGYENLRLESEEVAEFDYRPGACGKSYRMVVLRKNILVEEGQKTLLPDYRYFFYITNDRESSAAEIVREANRRCDQENLNAQLKSGVRALYAPVDTLLANWAYMAMTALAWNLKAWWALSLPEEKGRWHQRHQAEKRQVLRMEFKTFVNAFMQIPCQIVRTGRRLVYRVLAWNPWQPVFFRFVHRLQC